MAITRPAVQPIVLKDVNAVFKTAASDGVDVAAALDSVTLTPSASTTTWTGMAGNTHSAQSTATWAVNINYAQDLTAGQLSRFLIDREGETLDFEFSPAKGAAPKISGKVIITPGAIGGAVNQVSTASVTLPMVGKPTMV